MVLNMRVAQESDRYALSMLAMCLSEVKTAYETMHAEGRVMQFESGAQQVSPYFSIFTKAMSQAMKIMAEFGMTPAARTKVRALAVKDEQDPFDAYMKRGSGTK
jgi:P27 family predicted phage terminase small subunit